MIQNPKQYVRKCPRGTAVRTSEMNVFRWTVIFRLCAQWFITCWLVMNI